ncbi:hypothetical protein VTN02DRAFT_4068 [Thermoascus thermophilus]
MVNIHHLPCEGSIFGFWPALTPVMGHTSLPRGSEGTIYEKEQGFDDELRIQIDPTKITIIKELKRSEASSIVHVNYDGKPRVLKVFHNDGDAGYADDGVRDLNRARCEIRTYCSLK